MATIFMDNSEIYGVPAALIDGMYADALNTQLTTIAGKRCFWWNTAGEEYHIRRVLPTTQTNFFMAGRLRTTTLPATNARSVCMRVLNNSNVCVLSVWVDTTGRLVVSQGNPGSTEIVRSASPVITANTWHFIECHFNQATGGIEIRTDDSDDPTISITGATIATAYQFTYGTYAGDCPVYWTDIHVWDTTGTRNTGFLGDVAVTTLWPNEDVQTGWTPNYRHNIGDGILSNITNSTTVGSSIYCADSSSLQVGSSDFTIESFIRFNELPTGSQRASVVSKWEEATNNRSYQLSKCGPGLNSGNLEFRVSADGISPVLIHSVPWEPETDRWYSLAVVRASGQNMLFIDGIMQGVPQTDAYTYYNDTSVFAIGCEMLDGFFGPRSVLNTTISGWFDETRFSHYARYLVNYTPTTVPYGRNVTDDPQFATVAFLAGYDSSLTDESSYSRTITAQGSNGFGQPTTSVAAISITDDGFFQYQTINAEDTPSFGPPRDDTNISASYYNSTAILTLGDNPSNAETVTIAGQVYTFKNTLASAFDVKIGGTIGVTLQNLAAAVNDSGGEGTLYGTGTTPNSDVYAVELLSPQMQVVAIVAGAAGNALTVSEALDGSWSGATLDGGADIPGPSSFRLTRLPPNVTTIRSVMAVTRAYKTEAGPAKMRTNFVGPAGAVDLGAERTLSTEPQYRVDVFEEDPDTSGPITPSTLIQGRIQYDRTE